MRINTIQVQGKSQENPFGIQPSQDVLDFKQSIIIEPYMRTAGKTETIQLEDSDIVELIYEDGTIWFANCFTLDEIFPEMREDQRSGGHTLPIWISPKEDQRGLFSNILLKAVNIFSQKELVPDNVKKLATTLEEKQLNKYIGLFRLDTKFQFQKIISLEQNTTYLLFLHGTASSTQGSFGDLLETETWRTIEQTYGDRILAFQHASLTKSPVENIYDLVKMLPSNITLDLISQSRGGLLGELLSRFCVSDENNMGFTKSEMDYFKKSYPADYYDTFENTVNNIRNEIKQKKVRIKKFIRIACPAHGTLLASKRLDNFFNILFNLFGIATGHMSSPVYIAFKNLAASVVDCKNDVYTLPGLEAMDPRSAFIKMLNSLNRPDDSDVFSVDNSLTIISGNAKANISLKGLLVIASKLFNLEKTDLIVNTESMYLGTKRSKKVQYFFDEGTNVTHFNYFKNESTRVALLSALKSDPDEDIPGFTKLNQNLILNVDRQAFGLDGGKIFLNTVTGTKPIVLLIPGIMGSNLSENDHPIWIKYLQLLAGNLAKLDIAATNITAPSLIKSSYSKIVEHLSITYDVVTFAFDWRLHLNDTAEKLKNKIEELQSYKQPIKIIAHSMGGVLLRDFIITQPKAWGKLNASPGFRLLFLGAPLGGSYRIPAVLLGKDKIIDMLSKIDQVHTKKELLSIFFKFPGLLSLLPFSIKDDFSEMSTWNRITGLIDSDWPIPKAADLKTFRNYRNTALDLMKKIDFSNAVYIAGKDKSTPCGYSIEPTSRGEELIILCTAEGDQSVTWESGIPEQMIKNNSVYYVDVTHGSLANEPDIFDAIDELLERKNTTLISTARPEIRGSEKLFRQPESFDFDLSPESMENTILGISKKEKVIIGELPIQVMVSLGDLKYSSFPLLAGHFKNESLINSEKRMDDILKGVLSRRQQLGLYPDDIGSSELLMTSDQDFKGAIILGLGNHEEFSAAALAKTVEQGVTKYLLDLNSDTLLKEHKSGTTNDICLSSLIIGCGYDELSIEYSIIAILNGIQNANAKINTMHGRKVKNIKTLEFVECFEDRAVKCYYILSQIEKDTNKALNINLCQNRINPLPGSKKRLSIQTEDAFWSRITVKETKEEDGLLFTLSTDAAREEERSLYINTPMIDILFNEISNNNQWSPEVAKTIFELLIPTDFKAQLKRQNNINWLLDKKTASYPWELLQDAVSNASPLCVNAGMIRQLATSDYRIKIDMVAGNNALVIGDPKLNGFASQLKGARMEAELVDDLLKQHGYSSIRKIGSNAPDIIKAIFGKDINYKILHLAGHGIFDADPTKHSGMVIGEDVFLSTKQISLMSSVEFVFVNCCYLGTIDSKAEKFYRDRYKFAANIGTQLIENGVKAVIATGWAVDDRAGNEFAAEFYTGMLKGDTFGEAVKKARKIIYDKYSDQNNTWGAYQCYGDPFYRFDTEMKTNTLRDFEFTMPQEAEIALFNLHSDIDTNQYSYIENTARLNAISAAIEKAGINNQQLIEKEGLIYADLGHYDMALMKFQQLLEHEKANFRVSSIEKYCNIRAKKYVADFQQKTTLQEDLAKKMDNIVDQLNGLIAVNDTAERNSLIASVYKRKAYLCAGTEKIEAIHKAAEFYLKAHNKLNNGQIIYNILNWIELQVILWNIKQEEKTILPPTTVVIGKNERTITSRKDALQLLEEINNAFYISTPDKGFWNLVSNANMKLCKMMLEVEKDSWTPVYDAYRKVWEYAGARNSRIAEKEHLDLLIDGLNINKTDNSVLIEQIGQLKNELEKMI